MGRKKCRRKTKDNAIDEDNEKKKEKEKHKDKDQHKATEKDKDEKIELCGKCHTYEKGKEEIKD